MSKQNGNLKKTSITLKPDPRNARKHSERNQKLIRQSLESVGAGRSILVDAKNIVRAGNGVYEQAQALGIPVRVIETNGKELIAVKRTDLKGKDAIRAAALDNIVSDSSAHDYDAEILAEIANDDELIAALVKEDNQLAALLAQTNTQAETADVGELVDRAAESQKKWNVQRGDVWEIESKTVRGKCHRIMCGDSTNVEDVESLMNGEKANLVFTDPPYGVDYGGGRNPKSNTPREKLKGDDSGALYIICMDNCAKYAEKSAPVYLWFAASVGKPVYEAVALAGYTVRAMIVWNKIDAHYGNFMAQYMQKHEPCLYCVRDAPKWIGATNEVTVWDVKQPSKNDFHSTQKPVELAVRAIGNHDAKIVADWFLGSGTTLVACEQTGRIGRGMEIEPKYVAVALERLSLLGLEPRRVAQVKHGKQGKQAKRTYLEMQVT